MKIYLDYIFIENLIVNYIIISAVIKVTKESLTNKRKIFYLLIDSLICVFIYKINSILLQFIINNIIIFFLLKPNSIIKHIKFVLIYYFAYIIFIGTIIIIAIIFSFNLDIFLSKIIVYLIGGIITKVVIKDMWKMWKTNFIKQDLNYTLDINNEKINVFVDSGNLVKDPLTNLNVIFLDNKYSNLINDNAKIDFCINSINGQSELFGYIFKDIGVYKKEVKIGKIDKIIISFTFKQQGDKYSGIVGYDTYLECFKGVEL